MPGTASFDAQDRIIQQLQTYYQFNSDGQLFLRNSDTFQYSAQGELLQSVVAGKTVTYTHDGMGRRVARTDSTGTSQYLYGNLNQPFQLTAMRDPAGLLSTFYYDDAGVMFSMDKNSSRYYIATDQVGTLKVVSDSTGTIVKAMTFDSFGFPQLDSNPSLTVPVGFAGGLTDENTGLVRFGYRDYDPYTGRWTAKDPIFFKGGQGNLYVYVQNNPINRIDPFGLEQVIVGTRGGVPIVVDTNTGQVLTGPKNNYVDPLTDIARDVASLAEKIIDKTLNNTVTDIIGSIPPGESTGIPAADLGLNGLQIVQDAWNRLKKHCGR